MLQMRQRSPGGSGKGRWYSPNRDLVYLLPSAVESVFSYLEMEDPWVMEYAENGGDLQDFDEVAIAIATFISLAGDERDPVECWKKAGMSDVNPACLDFVARRIFRAFLGVFHKGIGNLSAGDEESDAFVSRLKSFDGLEYLRECHWRKNPWWFRFVVKWRQWRKRRSVTPSRSEVW